MLGPGVWIPLSGPRAVIGGVLTRFPLSSCAGVEGRCYVKGELSKTEGPLCKMVSSLWDRAESDSVPKTKPLLLNSVLCLWRWVHPHLAHTNWYSVILGEVQSFCHPQRPWPPLSTPCSWLFFFSQILTEGIFHTGKIMALYSLSASKGRLWNLGSQPEAPKEPEPWSHLFCIYTPSRADKLSPQTAKGSFSA